MITRPGSPISSVGRSAGIYEGGFLQHYNWSVVRYMILRYERRVIFLMMRSETLKAVNILVDCELIRKEADAPNASFELKLTF